MITQVQTEQMLRQVGKTLAAFDNATDYIVSVSWETPVGVKCCCVASTPTLNQLDSVESGRSDTCSHN